MNRHPQIDPLTASLIDAELSQRLAWIQQDHWVNTLDAKIALQWMEYLRRAQPRQRPPCMLIRAESGLGKTALLDQYASLHPMTIDADSPLDRTGQVLLANALQAGAGMPGLRCALMRAAWGVKTGFDHVSASDLDATLIRLGVKLVLLDEAGELIRGGRAICKRLLAEIRRLNHDHRISIVAASLEDVAHVFSLDPQLDSRFKRRLTIDVWKESQSFRNFLFGLERFLPFPERSGLDKKKPVEFLLSKTLGNTEAIVDTIRMAATIALEQGASCVTLKMLEDAVTIALPPAIAIRTQLA